jgi:hypothetical protein
LSNLEEKKKAEEAKAEACRAASFFAETAGIGDGMDG